MGDLDLAAALAAIGWVEVSPGVWRRDRCPTRKRVYGTREQAEQALAEVKGRRRKGRQARPAELRAYRCNHCAGYHLTHVAYRPPRLAA